MPNLESALLDALLDRYERSRGFKENRSQRRRVQLQMYGGGKTDFPAYDIEDSAARTAVNEAAGRLAEQGVTLTLRGHQSTAAVAIDRNQFRRVVENLLTNCVKYKTTPQADVDIVIAEEGESVVVSFVDHGVGVPAESLPKLFDSFYRTDAARTDVKKGSGLGLAIAKQIIESLHGSIWAEETKGGGLTISMRLPIAKEE